MGKQLEVAYRSGHQSRCRYLDRLGFCFRSIPPATRYFRLKVIALVVETLSLFFKRLRRALQLIQLLSESF